MKMWIIMFAACVACGCATHRQIDFPADALNADDAQRLSWALHNLNESPFWTSKGSPFPEHHTAYRLTIIPSLHCVACVTIHNGPSLDSILRTKIYSWSYKEPIQPDSMQIESAGLVFDESRILTSKEMESFRGFFVALDGAAEGYPPDVLSIFACLDGTSFFLEASEFGRYRIIKICDPPTTPLHNEAKEVMRKMFPDVNVENIEPCIRRYVDVLAWFAKETNLSLLENYKGSPNQAPEDTARKLADPQRCRSADT